MLPYDGHCEILVEEAGGEKGYVVRGDGCSFSNRYVDVNCL